MPESPFGTDDLDRLAREYLRRASSESAPPHLADDAVRYAVSRRRRFGAAALLAGTAIVAASAAAAAAGLALHSWTTKPPAATPPIVAVHSPTPTPGPTPSPSQVPTPSPAELRSCPSADLAARVGWSSGAGGSMHPDIELTNVTANPCTLEGYFGVAFLDAKGAIMAGGFGDDPYQIPAFPEGIALIRLSPGDSAFFILNPGWAPLPGQRLQPPECPAASEMRLTAPGQSDHIVVSAMTSDGFAMGACPGTDIGPVVASHGYLVPAIGLPAQGVTECSLALTHDADGNVTPLFCADGGVNTQAWFTLAPDSPALLSQGAVGTASSVAHAICTDINVSHATAPTEYSMVELAARYYRWTFRLPSPPYFCG
jgi:hypothetical protein